MKLPDSIDRLANKLTEFFTVAERHIFTRDAREMRAEEDALAHAGVQVVRDNLSLVVDYAEAVSKVAQSYQSVLKAGLEPEAERIRFNMNKIIEKLNLE